MTTTTLATHNVRLEEMFARACNEHGRAVTSSAAGAFVTSRDYALSLGHRQLEATHIVGNILRNPAAAPTKAIKHRFGLADELSSCIVDREISALFLRRRYAPTSVVLLHSVPDGLESAAELVGETFGRHSVTQSDLLYGMLHGVFVGRLMRRLGLDIDEVRFMLASSGLPAAG
jgi:hypothetical protein